MRYNVSTTTESGMGDGTIIHSGIVNALDDYMYCRQMSAFLTVTLTEAEDEPEDEEPEVLCDKGHISLLDHEIECETR